MNFDTKESWIIQSPIEKQIKEKVGKIGVPLKDWNIKINFGIKTGYNPAFIINGETRTNILNGCKTPEEQTRTDALIRPILRGKDVQRYESTFADQWVLFIPWHFPLHTDSSIVGASEKAEAEFSATYPTVYSHLLMHKEKLSARNKAETGIRYEWYVLQRWGAKYWEVYPLHRKSMYRDIMTRITTLSVPKKDEGAWKTWSAHPANRNVSQAVLRLIRKDLHENQEMYGR